MSKYRNVKTLVGGRRFDSKAEAAQYLLLLGRLQKGEIADLELQPSFPLEVNGLRVCTYRADFRYLDLASGRRVVEDVKGVRTPVYRIKKKLVKALYGIDVQEVVIRRV
jgi:hypothetical protein